MSRHKPNSKHRKKLFRRPEGHALGQDQIASIGPPQSAVRVSALRYSASDLLERDLKSPHEITALREADSILWINVDGI